MITFGRKLKHLRQKNHLTQKGLGMAMGFPEDSADVRIVQYESAEGRERATIHSVLERPWPLFCILLRYNMLIITCRK